MTFQIDTSSGCALQVKEPQGISDSFCTIRVLGINSDGNSVTQDQILSFANDCKSLVFNNGDQIGWLRVVSIDT